LQRRQREAFEASSAVAKLSIRERTTILLQRRLFVGGEKNFAKEERPRWGGEEAIHVAHSQRKT